MMSVSIPGCTGLPRRRCGGAVWKGLAAVSDRDYFDADTMAALAGGLVERAASEGNCVIVGRGAQCLLQRREDVFHVFVYAPLHLKAKRVQARMTLHRMEKAAQGFPACWSIPIMISFRRKKVGVHGGS